MHAGDIPQGVFYVKKGLIRLYSVSHDGEEFTLIIFKPGDFFPISWAIADIPNNYFLEALSVLEIWRVEKASFVAFVKKKPGCALRNFEHDDGEAYERTAKDGIYGFWQRLY